MNRSTLRRVPRSPWLLAVGAAAGQFAVSSVGGRPDDASYYRELKQAPFAPPSWAFAPAWAVARTGTAYALVRTWRHGGARRGRALALYAADAAIFVSFSYVYFRKRSPVLAAAWTTADAILVGSLLAAVAPEDKRAATALLPQAAWLALATPAGLWQAAVNPDPLLGLEAPLSG